MSTSVVPFASPDEGRAGWPLINMRFCLKSSLNSAREMCLRSKLRLCFRRASMRTWSRRGHAAESSSVIRKEFAGCSLFEDIGFHISLCKKLRLWCSSTHEKKSCSRTSKTLFCRNESLRPPPRHRIDLVVLVVNASKGRPNRAKNH